MYFYNMSSPYHAVYCSVVCRLSLLDQQQAEEIYSCHKNERAKWFSRGGSSTPLATVTDSRCVESCMLASQTKPSCIHLSFVSSIPTFNPLHSTFPSFLLSPPSILCIQPFISFFYPHLQFSAFNFSLVSSIPTFKSLHSPSLLAQSSVFPHLSTIITSLQHTPSLNAHFPSWVYMVFFSSWRSRTSWANACRQRRPRTSRSN